MFKAELDRTCRSRVRMVKDFSKRFRAVRQLLTLYAVSTMRTAIIERIPRRNEWKPYRESLETAWVKNSGKDIDLAVIRTNLKKLRLSGLDARKANLYSRRAKKASQRSIKSTREIADFRRNRTKKSSNTRFFLENLKKSRTKRRYFYKPSFRRLPKKKKSLTKRDVIQNLANLVLKMEFGLDGVPSVPHWRPAFFKARKSGKEFFARKDIKEILIDPKNTKWKKIPDNFGVFTTLEEAGSLLSFQKKLGLIGNM